MRHGHDLQTFHHGLDCFGPCLKDRRNLRLYGLSPWRPTTCGLIDSAVGELAQSGCGIGARQVSQHEECNDRVVVHDA